MKFGVKVVQSEPIKKLESFANANKQTQGKFTIGDEKVCILPYMRENDRLTNYSNTTSS